MNRWVGRVALVTGASVGIGEAIARALVRNGLKVVGCARDVQKIKEISDSLKKEACAGELYAVQCDLSVEDDITRMFADIRASYGRLDVCVNNAGLAHSAPLLSGSNGDWRNMLEVNVLALAIVSREAYKLMKENNIDDGQFIHIGSLSGHRVINSGNSHFYSLTKHAVRAHMEGLRNELRSANSHIRCVEISPGLVETEFAYRMRKNDEDAHKLYSSLECLQASDVADSVLYVLSTPSHVQIHDILMRPTEQKS